MKFEIERQKLTCQSCGFHRDPQPTLHHPAGEQDFLATLPTPRAQKWHLGSAQPLNCSGCGATFTLPKLQISGECPFCGSLHVLETMAQTDLIEPDGVVTFQINEPQARQATTTWLKQQFSPQDKIRTSRLHAIYVPCWTFDLDGEVTFYAYNQPSYDTEGFTFSGKWVGDIQHLQCDDLLVLATHTVPLSLLDQAGDYKTSTLRPYSSEILAAWAAEVYQISLANASLIARQHAINLAKQTHPVTFPVDVSHGLPFFHGTRIDSAHLSVKSYKLILLPLWLRRYRLKRQTYRLIVNGQTGKAAGEKPANGWRQQLSHILGTD